MPRVRILIVDDETLARDALRLLLSNRESVEIIGECQNGREAVEAIELERPDLVFLDIQMPEMDGFEVIRTVGPDKMPAVIFATAYDQYAVKAFEAQALDYLLKPIEDDRFEQALERAVKRLREERVGEVSAQLVGLLGYRDSQDASPTPTGLEETQASGYERRFLIKAKDIVTFVAAADIDWIEAAGDYVVLHAGPSKHLLRESMTGMERRLDPTAFVRIHRSTIVNMGRIKELRPYFHGDYIVYLNDGKELKLSRRYWKQAEARLARG